jgi:hypothetical protein
MSDKPAGGGVMGDLGDEPLPCGAQVALLLGQVLLWVILAHFGVWMVGGVLHTP